MVKVLKKVTTWSMNEIEVVLFEDGCITIRVGTEVVLIKPKHIPLLKRIFEEIKVPDKE